MAELLFPIYQVELHCDYCEDFEVEEDEFDNIDDALAHGKKHNHPVCCCPDSPRSVKAVRLG